MPANYDRTAWFYDTLANIVFGNTLIRAQQHLLPLIPPRSRILIVGGGTGRILEDIAAIHPEGLNIMYVEISPKMTAHARKRNVKANKVKFTIDAVEHVPLQPEFDVIITSFLFDNYTEQSLPFTFGHLHTALLLGGIWLNTDFQVTGKWWQPLLLKSMYRFFKLFSNIPVSVLPDVKKQFLTRGYQLVDSQTFYGNFIVTECYKNPLPR